jgi:hypothetical protein
MISTSSLAVGVQTGAELIPTNAAPVLSSTSDALACFSQQQFSAKLQTYLVSYVMAVGGYYSLYSGFNPE